jgi:hypothetical protein
MPLDEISFLVGLMIIPFLFLFVRKVLFNPKYNTPLLIFASILFILGLTQVKNDAGGRPNFYLFLFCPLYSLTLFRVLLYFFKHRFQREPKDPPRLSTFSNDGMNWDRLFNMTFFILSVCLPVALLACFYN